MLATLLLTTALGASGETSFLNKLPRDLTVKSWLNTSGWRNWDDLAGKVVLLEFWATW